MGAPRPRPATEQSRQVILTGEGRGATPETSAEAPHPQPRIFTCGGSTPLARGGAVPRDPGRGRVLHTLGSNNSRAA
eukprot:1698220-Pyramimonas_sp.AAC.1